jgi:hypothetical protein
MGKRKGGDVDEVVAVVPRGPLGPWRLSLAVAAAAVFTGMPLLDAAQTGLGLDMALARSFGVAFLVWIASGWVNKMLAAAMPTDDDDLDTDVDLDADSSRDEDVVARQD